MTTTERLLSIRAKILEDLDDLANPEKRRPTYSLDGKSVSWGEYWASRLAALRDLDEYLAKSDPGQMIISRME